MTTFYEFPQPCPDDEACLPRITVERYGEKDLDCPTRGVHGKFYRMTRQRDYVFRHCKHQSHPTVGLIMERSQTPPHKWFYAMHLFSTSRRGVAAKELQRQISVTYKTAWRMAHEIGKYRADVDDELCSGGEVEAGKIYIGGKTTGGKRGRGGPHKTVVFGMLERGGDIMANVVANVKKRMPQRIVVENVGPGTTVHTDGL